MIWQKLSSDFQTDVELFVLFLINLLCSKRTRLRDNKIKINIFIYVPATFYRIR